MTVGRLLLIAAFTSACGGGAATERSEPATPAEVAIAEGDRKTSTDPAVNPNDAAEMAEFKTRVEKYADLHRDLAKGAAAQKETSDPAKISAAKAALASKVQAARAGAQHGDIFTPAIRPVFRRLLAPELKGEDGRDTKAAIKDDAPEAGTVPFKVNATYPDGQPMPTMPANLLLTLPPLPAPLEYRVVGQHLLLLDTATDLIVDYILNAIVT